MDTNREDHMTDNPKDLAQLGNIVTNLPAVRSAKTINPNSRSYRRLVKPIGEDEGDNKQRFPSSTPFSVRPAYRTETLATNFDCDSANKVPYRSKFGLVVSPIPVAILSISICRGDQTAPDLDTPQYRSSKVPSAVSVRLGTIHDGRASAVAAGTGAMSAGRNDMAMAPLG